MQVTVKVGRAYKRNVVLDTTAKFAAYLVAEGWEVWARPAQWRRISKHASKMGMNINESTFVELTMTAIQELMFNNEFAALCNLVDLEDQYKAEIDTFILLEEFNIMGMIDALPEDTAAPMWGNSCLN
jgi:hypothetical protein